MEFLENLPNLKVLAIQKWDNIKYQFEKFRDLCPMVTNINVIATIFYKIYHCNELKKQYELENNFKYDLVIRTRGDQVFEKKINLDFPTDKILINAYPWGDEDYVHHFIEENNRESEINCINDRFAVGNSENIDVLCDIYNHLEELISSSENVQLEYLLNKYLKLNNIELEKKNLSFYVKHNPPRLPKP